MPSSTLSFACKYLPLFLIAAAVSLECYLTPVVKALLTIRKCYKGREWGWIGAEIETDSVRATLLLLGLEGKAT